MSNAIDLVVVDTNYKSAICYAPYGVVKVGDTVITDSGTGTVTEAVFTYGEDEVYKFFKRNIDILQVRSVVMAIDYEGVDA